MSKHQNLQDSELFEEKYGYKERRAFTRFCLIIFLVIFALLSFRYYWTNTFGGVTVSGRSMCNTLYSGEQLLMKYTDGSDAKRGDVIVVYVGNYEEFGDEGTPNKTEYLIKRLIAIEGDKVRCQDGQIEICYSGQEAWVALDEPYAYYTNKEGYDFGEYAVGEGEIFFLGDNRNNSQDSRYNEIYGSRLDCLYKRSDIIGIVPQWAIDHQEILEKIFFWNA